MRQSTRIIAFVGTVLAAWAGVLMMLRRDEIQPVGRLSREEVQQVRYAVKQSFRPKLSWFKPANFRQWPSFAGMALTFRVVEIKPDSLGIITFHPDGSQEEWWGVTVSYGYIGCPTNTCYLEKKNDRWMVISS